MSYADLFDKVLAKPGMYVGNCSIERIRAFMDGYIHAKWEAGECSQDDPYFGFTEWVAKRYEVGRTHHWVSIVQFMSGSEASAFELTKKLWGGYRAGENSKRT